MYVTLEEIKALDIKNLANLNDDILISEIGLVSKEIDEYCNTRFEPANDKYTLDYKKVFYTRKQPFINIESLILQGEIQQSLIEDTDFFVYTEKSRIEMADLEIKKIKKALCIEYMYGYVETPSTVKKVLIDIIKLDADTKDTKLTGGIVTETWEDYSYSLYSSKDFTPIELRKNILSRLDMFKVLPYIETENNRLVNVRLL